MEIPDYLLPELERRLGHIATREERVRGLEILDLSEEDLDIEPNVSGLIDRFDSDYQIGSYILPCVLDFFRHQSAIHLKVSYVAMFPSQHIRRGDAEPAIQIEILTWTEENKPRPHWSIVGPCVLSEGMMAEIRAGIHWHVSEATNGNKAVSYPEDILRMAEIRKRSKKMRI